MITGLERCQTPAATHTVIRSRAPLRISFCGGGTDVPPYPLQYGGCVLSCTIDKYAYVSLRRYRRGIIRVRAEDLGVEADLDVRGHEPSGTELNLPRAIFERFRATGLECYMQCDAPPGSGLGSSSAMIVALIYAVACERNIHLDSYEVAELAIAVERGDLKILGGLQDQYASAFGGFNLIEFTAKGNSVTPLRLPSDLLAELHHHLLLCYTGTTRLSADILAEQTAGVVSRERPALEALAKMKALTYDLKRALLNNRMLEFGEILDEAWALKRQLAAGITNAGIEELYAAARRAGGIGGKILGAGGGGYLLVCVPFYRRSAVRTALERMGGRIVDFQFEDRGVRVWHARPDTWSRCS